MSYRFIERERIHYPVTVLCHVLAVPRSGYYAWRERGESRRTRDNQQLLEQIRTIYTRSKQRYGSPRIHDALRNQGTSRTPSRSASDAAGRTPRSQESTAVSRHDE